MKPAMAEISRGGKIPTKIKTIQDEIGTGNIFLS